MLPSDSALQNTFRSVDEHRSLALSDLMPTGRLVEYWCAVAVAEELHFTRAANRLHIDQSALSRHVQKLEASLGLTLFVRGERRIELTEAAQAFIPFAKKTLLSARFGVRMAQAISRGEPQQCEIAYSASVDTRIITGMMALIKEARPRIPVRFRSFAAERLINRFKSLIRGNEPFRDNVVAG